MSDEPRPITALSDVKPAAAKKPARRRWSKDEDFAEEVSLPEDEINHPDRKWYFVHTYSGHENKVRHAIKSTIDRMDAKDKVFHVVVPTEDEIEIRDGQRRTVKRKLYPGYVLVQTIELKSNEPDVTPDDKKASDETWHMIRNTTGVTGFVSSGDKPVSLTKDEVNHILRAMRMEQPRIRVGFVPGKTSASSPAPSKTSSARSTKSTPKRAKSKSSSTCSAARPRSPSTSSKSKSSSFRRPPHTPGSHDPRGCLSVCPWSRASGRQRDRWCARALSPRPTLPVRQCSGGRYLRPLRRRSVQ